MAGPLLTRRRVLAAKIETTPGTAIALAAADAAFNVFDAKIAPKYEKSRRMQQGGFANLPSGKNLGDMAEVSFYLEPTGGSATPGWAAAFLPACGLGYDSDSYNLDQLPPEAATSTLETLTIGLYQDGVYKQIHGAMGNVKFTFEAGKIVKAEFIFTGIYTTPTDVAILAPTYPTGSPLRFISSALSLGGWAPKINQFTLDLGNKVFLRPDSTTASGYSSAVITDREIKGTFDPESTLVATKAIHGLVDASTEMALSLVCAAGDDDATFTAGGLEILNAQDGDRDGLLTDALEFAINDDDLKILFS